MRKNKSVVKSVRIDEESAEIMSSEGVSIQEVVNVYLKLAEEIGYQKALKELDYASMKIIVDKMA